MKILFIEKLPFFISDPIKVKESFFFVCLFCLKHFAVSRGRIIKSNKTWCKAKAELHFKKIDSYCYSKMENSKTRSISKYSCKITSFHSKHCKHILMAITGMSIDEVFTNNLSEEGLLQKQLDNQHEHFNVQVVQA